MFDVNLVNILSLAFFLLYFIHEMNWAFNHKFSNFVLDAPNEALGMARTHANRSRPTNLNS